MALIAQNLGMPCLRTSHFPRVDSLSFAACLMISTVVWRRSSGRGLGAKVMRS